MTVLSSPRADGVHFSTGLPNCREGRLHPLGSVEPDWLIEVSKLADRLGYYSLWTNEFLATDPNVAAKFDGVPTYYDPLLTFAWVATVTGAIRFVTSTIVLPLHEPVLLGRQLATLDVLTQGRVTLGIGLGGKAEEFHRIRGELTVPNRGLLMDEYVGALRALWEEPRASFAGQHVRFDDLVMSPKPTQRPLPIFMAGDAEGVLRRLARYGQGWIDTTALPEAIASRKATLAGYLREAGRADESLSIARQFYVSLASTDDEAIENHRRSLAGSKAAVSPSNPPEKEVNLVGTPETVARRLSDYVKAGVDEICVIFYAPDKGAALRQMELFASDVVPAVGR